MNMQKSIDFLENENSGRSGSNSLPRGWERKNFGSIVIKSQYGLSVPTTEDGEYPMFKMNNFFNGRMNPVGLDKASISTAELKSYKLNKNDILFNRTNSLDLVGKTAIFDLEGDYTFASYTKSELD